MDTHFAPAERASGAQLQHDIAFAGTNPLVTTLLKTASGLLAVLNEERQILIVNDAFLDMLGVKDAGIVLGLRPGEAIQCVHAQEMPGGCGTSRFCSTCGAAVAIVSTLASETPQERKCIAAVERGGRTMDLCLRVRSCLLTFDGRKYILLFLQDITIPERRAELERVFFHDINNLIGGLVGASKVLCSENGHRIPELAREVHEVSLRLAREVALQAIFMQDDLADYQLTPQKVSIADILKALREAFSGHPVAKRKRLRLEEPIPQTTLITDVPLALRVLTNMLMNAFEATPDGGEVKLWVEQDGAAVCFCVWNPQAIPSAVALRVFQRHFTTKSEPGRGLGTYAMKLVGEQILGGTVDFTTSEQAGTVFRFCLPA